MKKPTTISSCNGARFSGLQKIREKEGGHKKRKIEGKFVEA